MKILSLLFLCVLLTACPGRSGEPEQPADSTRIDTIKPLPRAQRGGGYWLPTE